MAWTKEEDEVIISYHKKWGNRWTAISKLLKGRPANAIKNHWNSTLKKIAEQPWVGKPKKRKLYSSEGIDSMNKEGKSVKLKFKECLLFEEVCI